MGPFQIGLVIFISVIISFLLFTHSRGETFKDYQTYHIKEIEIAHPNPLPHNEIIHIKKDIHIHHPKHHAHQRHYAHHKKTHAHPDAEKHGFHLLNDGPIDISIDYPRTPSHAAHHKDTRISKESINAFQKGSLKTQHNQTSTSTRSSQRDPNLTPSHMSPYPSPSITAPSISSQPNPTSYQKN